MLYDGAPRGRLGSPLAYFQSTYIETSLVFKFVLFWTPPLKTFTYRLRTFQALINILNGKFKFLTHVDSYFRGIPPRYILADGKIIFTTNTTCLTVERFTFLFPFEGKWSNIVIGG